jgi:hypothetical protein
MLVDNRHGGLALDHGCVVVLDLSQRLDHGEDGGLHLRSTEVAVDLGNQPVPAAFLGTVVVGKLLRQDRVDLGLVLQGAHVGA